MTALRDALGTVILIVCYRLITRKKAALSKCACVIFDFSGLWTLYKVSPIRESLRLISGAMRGASAFHVLEL